MTILLTTHQMADFAGSEIYTYELAKALKKAGHIVTVYSRYIDSFAYLFAKEKIELTSDLASIQTRHFDVAHVHHHINALEVRLTFPKIPIFFLSHGAGTFLEKPPGIDINIAQYGAVSELVKKSLVRAGIPKGKIALVNNIVDDNVYAPEKPLRAMPRKALILSNRIDQKTTRKIKEACTQLGIDVLAAGASFRKVHTLDMPKVINESDIVFTIGRGVIETMMCGRVPFVFDKRGGDGILTTENFKKSAQFH